MKYTRIAVKLIFWTTTWVIELNNWTDIKEFKLAYYGSFWILRNWTKNYSLVNMLMSVSLTNWSFCAT